MDSKRYERSARSNSESPPAPPSPPMYSTSYSTTHDSNHKSRGSRQRSPSSPSAEQHHRSSRSSRNSSPLQERRSKRRRSGSRSSPPSRSHRRSRSSDRDRDRDRDRSRKYSRRDRSRSRSRGRSRSRDKRRSRSRNRSRDRHRYRESRRHHSNRAPSYESDALEEHGEGAGGQVMHQAAIVAPQPNAFKNDGSFMEMFKKMQEQMQPTAQKPTTSSVLEEKPVVPPPLMVGKRRGGRILKTGMVAKPKTEQTVEQPKDAWSLYMAEVKKYREVCCQEEDNTRPLAVPYIAANMTKQSDITEDTLQTAPFDPRFPNQNQTRYCYQSYVDFHRCKKKHNENYEACQYFKRVYTSMCPNAWVEKWDGQIDAGTFAGRI